MRRRSSPDTRRLQTPGGGCGAVCVWQFKRRPDRCPCSVESEGASSVSAELGEALRLVEPGIDRADDVLARRDAAGEDCRQQLVALAAIARAPAALRCGARR